MNNTTNTQSPTTLHIVRDRKTGRIIDATPFYGTAFALTMHAYRARVLETLENDRVVSVVRFNAKGDPRA